MVYGVYPESLKILKDPTMLPDGATIVDLSDNNYTLKAEFVKDQTISLSMWARVKTTTESNNSVFWAVNSDNFNTKNFSAKSEYQWINLATAAMSPGTSFFAFKYRETL